MSDMGKKLGIPPLEDDDPSAFTRTVLNVVGKVMTGTWYLKTEISNVHPVTVNFYRENSNQDSQLSSDILRSSQRSKFVIQNK